MPNRPGHLHLSIPTTTQPSRSLSQKLVTHETLPRRLIIATLIIREIVRSKKGGFRLRTNVSLRRDAETRWNYLLTRERFVTSDIVRGNKTAAIHNRCCRDAIKPHEVIRLQLHELPAEMENRRENCMRKIARCRNHLTENIFALSPVFLRISEKQQHKTQHRQLNKYKN